MCMTMHEHGEVLSWFSILHTSQVYYSLLAPVSVQRYYMNAEGIFVGWNSSWHCSSATSEVEVPLTLHLGASDRLQCRFMVLILM